ncbi:DnaJ-related protein scj1 [Savitreella phatthalungensis]
MLVRIGFSWVLVVLVCLGFVVGGGSGDDYYEILGLKKSDRPTERDFKKAYRTLSKKYHPDKNPGDEAAKDRFVKVASAYEVLSDKKKKATYDKYGEEGLKREAQGGSPHHDPFDVFSQFFGGGGRGGRRRGPNLESVVEIDLERIYSGSSFDVTVDKQVVCERCEGSGADSDYPVEECASCGGHGVKIFKIQLAPGMFQQVQQACDACAGKGSRITHKCTKCNGAKVYRAQESYVVDVPAGLPRNDKVIFEGEAEESPDIDTGDLVITIREDSRGNAKGWHRRRNDLFRTEAVSLGEALLGGWTRKITRLDGSVLEYGRRVGEVVQPGEVTVMEDEGMPAWQPEGYATGKGKAFIEWQVVLPKVKEGGDTAKQLAKLLKHTPEKHKSGKDEL